MICLNNIEESKVRIFIILQLLLYIIILNNKINHDEIFEKKNILNNTMNSITQYNEFKMNKEAKIYEREILLTKGRQYLDKCLKKENYEFYEKNENPMITTIIPTFNGEKTILASIHSVQYQNFSNIELIVIDDFSTDDSKKIVQKIQMNDKRIKLIDNKKKMGTLYSRSIGALFSKGYYILCLDSDDLFFDEDVFDYVYKRAINDNLDIVSFRSLFSYDYFADISKMKDFHFFGFQNNLFLSQPQLGIWTLNLNGKFRMHNHMIWSKSIKSTIYKKAVNLLGIKRYSIYLCWGEDTAINFIIFNIASSFKYIYKYGYMHIMQRESITYTHDINTKLYGELYFLDVMFDFSKNSSDKNFVVNQAIDIKSRFKINKYSNNTNNNYLKYILNKIIKCQFITSINKQKIKVGFKTFFM